MDKVKAFIIGLLGTIAGTTLRGAIIRVVIAVLSFYSGAATDAGDAVGIALDKDRSLAAAVELINETPTEELKAAVKAEAATNE